MTNGDAVREILGIAVTDRMLADLLQYYFLCENCSKWPNCERVGEGCRFALLDRIKAKNRGTLAGQKEEPVSIGDSIRHMTDGQLATLIWKCLKTTSCAGCPARSHCDTGSGDCEYMITQYLKADLDEQI